MFPVTVAPSAAAPSLSATTIPAESSDTGFPTGLDLALILGGACVVLGAVGFAVWRKRSAGLEDEAGHEIFVAARAQPPTDVPPPPASQPAPPPAQPRAVPAAPVAAPEARARLEIELHPKRAGTNLLSAAVEYGIGVRNSGAVAATGIRLDVRLLSAGSRQDATINALFMGPIGQPIIAPFDLPPEGTVELGGMAMHAKDTLEGLNVEGRTLFVPVLTINLRYDWAGGSGQSARSYVIGIDRGPGAKLVPFQLDATRMHDAVKAIEYTMSVVS